jgi:hypothetical protein
MEQVPDALDRRVRRQESADHFRVVSLGSLTREHSHHALSLELFGGCQDTQLVVHKDTILNRVTPLDVIRCLFLMTIE